MGFFEIILWAAGVTCSILLLIMLISATAKRKLRKDAAELLNSEGMSAYREVFNSGDAIGIDYERELIATVVNGTKLVTSFSSLISVEIAEDGSTVTKANRGSQAVGAAIGAAAFGGVGAIVGGLSGTTGSAEIVKKATLNIITGSPDAPFLQVKVYDGPEIKKSGIIYTEVTKQMMPWFGRLKAIIEAR